MAIGEARLPTLRLLPDGSIEMRRHFSVDVAAEVEQLASNAEHYDLWSGPADDGATLLDGELRAEYGDAPDSTRCVFHLPNRHRLDLVFSSWVQVPGGFDVQLNYRSAPDQ